MSDNAARQSVELAPPPAGWLSAGEAARALGKNVRSVQRYCEEGRLVAKLCGSSAAPMWFIDPSCKPALWLAAGHADPVPAIAGDVLTGLSDAKRGRILQRQEIIAAYEGSLPERPAGYSADAWMQLWCDAWTARQPGRPLSKATMYRWLAARNAEGLAGLVDRRGGFETAQPDPVLWQMFSGLYLTGSTFGVRQAYDLVAAEAARAGRPWPSLRTVQRWANERIAPIKKACGRQPKVFEDRFLPYVQRDWTAVPAMGVWIPDNRQLDLFCRVLRRHGPGGRAEWVKCRPWVQAWIDGRSWFPPAWSMSVAEPDSVATAELFAAGVSLHGAPAQIYADNGPGFRAEAFSGGRPNRHEQLRDELAEQINPIVTEMGVELVRFAEPYNHKAKPIEPWFRFVATEFDKYWSGYVGNCIAHRPGEADLIPIHELPTLEEVCRAFGEWLTNTFCRQASPAVAAAGLSPMRAFVELREPGREYCRPSDEVLCLLCRPSRPVRVYSQGVYVPEFGRHYWHAKLIERQGSGRDARRKISYRILPGRPERVFIFDERGRYFCTAEASEAAGMNPLIDAERQPEQAERLGRVMELRGAMARHYRRDVAADRQFAGNLLLAAQREGLRAQGCLDESAAPPPPAAHIRYVPGLEAGAAAMAAERDGEAEAGRVTARQRMLALFAKGQQEQEQEQTDAPKPVSQADLVDRLMRREQEQGHPNAMHGVGDPQHGEADHDGAR